MARVIWTEDALVALERALAFVARDSPGMAQMVARRIIQATDRLEDFPRSGRIVPEKGTDELRELIVYSYRIIYQIAGQEVQILAVHHGAMPLGDGPEV